MLLFVVLMNHHEWFMKRYEVFWRFHLRTLKLDDEKRKGLQGATLDSYQCSMISDLLVYVSHSVTTCHAIAIPEQEVEDAEPPSDLKAFNLSFNIF